MGGITVLWVADLTIARLYGAEGSGQFYVWWTLAVGLTILSLLGLGDLVVRDMASNGSKQERSASIDYARLLALVGGTSVVLSAVLVAVALSTDGGLGAVAMAVSVVPAALSILHLQLLRAVGRPAVGAVLNNVVPSILLVVLLLTFPPDGFSVLGTAYLLSRISGLVIIAGTWLRWFGGSPRANDQDKRQWRSRLRAGRRLLLAQLSEYALAWSDLILLALLVGVSATGVYAIAGRIAASANLVQESVNARSGPAIARLLADDEPSSAGTLVRSLSTRAAMLVFPPVFVLALLREPILGLFGPEFRTGSTALVLLLVAQTAQVVGGPYRTLLALSHHEGVLARAFTIAIIVNVLLNLVLIPRYGIEGAAVATLVALWLRNGLIIWKVRRDLPAVG